MSAIVEYRALEAQVIGRGHVKPESSTNIGCYPAGEGSPANGTHVFTKSPTPGGTVREGDVIAGVNARPVILMQGSTAAFRDILPGSSGPDVQQLQESLSRVGLDIGNDHKGEYGSGTQAAVERLYDRLGFRAKGPTREESSRLTAARLAAAQADASLAQAKAALDAATTTHKADALNAEIALKEALLRKSQASTSSEREIADLGVRAAKLHAEALARRTTRAETDALSLAKKVSVQSHDELQHLERTVGTTVPFCEVVFSPTTPVTTRAPVKAATDSEEHTGWVSLDSATLVLDVEFSEVDGKLVREGATATLRPEGARKDEPATVTHITQSPAGGIVARIMGETPFGPDSVATNVRVGVTVASSQERVLVIPLAALTGVDSGDAKVIKLDISGKETPVLVSAGLVSGGYVQVTPLEPQLLKEGDRVRLGT